MSDLITYTLLKTIQYGLVFIMIGSIVEQMPLWWNW